MRLQILCMMLAVGLWSCTEDAQTSGNSQSNAAGTLFQMMTAAETGIDFTNQLDYDKQFNIYTYRNFYNGGGVALVDINNDGLTDVYFTANMKKNKLYLNKGNFEFEDITETAGVGGEKSWSTGVSIADVNADGLLDIYVCNSGDVAGDNKQNELFINQGDLTFKESAEAYGLADKGFSTHAAFFDYDKDGDLDVYLLNNSYRAIGSFNLRKNERPKRDPVGGDKLFENVDGKFVDVSEKAGIYGSIIGFGLGVTVGDIDRDGWDDIYISNDFFERDYIYMNNGDGTFREELEAQMKSISGASMGADMGDMNNDGYPEIFVTEMLPRTEARFKTKMTFESWDKYQLGVDNGYYHQFTRNMLHQNNGDGTFSEIGRMAGVEATDWSWAPLMTDLDNDGVQDIFVANGIHKDLVDQDYIQYISNDEVKRQLISKDGVNFKEMIDVMPSEKIPNYMFRGQGGMAFEEVGKDWGLSTPSHSNGSAYADLDNDGDLDLVVNNVNMPAFIYQNQSNKETNHYLQVQLEGIGANPFALGTKVTLKKGEKIFYKEHIPIRGFQSTMDYKLTFGLGDIEQLDEVIIDWPNGQQTKLSNVNANQLLEAKMADANAKSSPKGYLASTAKTFKSVKQLFDYQHQENAFVDFDIERLLYQMNSNEGPCLAVGNINKDGTQDVFLGGAKDQAAKFFGQKTPKAFGEFYSALTAANQSSEDVDALFFDANGDGIDDLYVVSGGSEFSNSAVALMDQLYLSTPGKGMVRSTQALPTNRFENTSTVSAGDYDQDGDIDLFVGCRMRSKIYGTPVSGYILQNDGKGKFKNVSKAIAPELKQLGMMTDSEWVDIDGDKDLDLIIVGEWLAITILKNENGQFTKTTIPKTNGWWNAIEMADLDKDGDMDFVLANHGVNSRFAASTEEPILCHINDFDQNGTVEQLISVYNEGVAYPLTLRHDLIKQLPSLKKKYIKYENYVGQKIEDIFTEEQLANTLKHEVYMLESVVLINDGTGQFKIEKLPRDAQLSSMYAIKAHDFDGDGAMDIVMGGNQYMVKPEVGRYDASYGVFLKGDGKGGFESIPNFASGLQLDGQIRDMEVVNDNILLVARNNDSVLAFGF